LTEKEQDIEHIPEVSYQKLKEIIEEKKNLVVQVNHTQDCLPCEYGANISQYIMQRSPGEIIQLNLNLEESSSKEIIDELGVTEFPTFIGYKEAKEHRRFKPTLNLEQDFEELNKLVDEVTPQGEA